MGQPQTPQFPFLSLKLQPPQFGFPQRPFARGPHSVSKTVRISRPGQPCEPSFHPLWAARADTARARDVCAASPELPYDLRPFRWSPIIVHPPR